MWKQPKPDVRIQSVCRQCRSGARSFLCKDCTLFAGRLPWPQTFSELQLELAKQLDPATERYSGLKFYERMEILKSGRRQFGSSGFTFWRRSSEEIGTGEL